MLSGASLFCTVESGSERPSSVDRSQPVPKSLASSPRSADRERGGFAWTLWVSKQPSEGRIQL
jgi:hypothetical protein